MTAGAILAIDQGTSNTKALLVDGARNVLARASRPMALVHPQPGWAEQSAADIWISVQQVIADITAQVPDIAPAALAISNQRETIVLWDAQTGLAVGPAISWQCRRSSERCDALRQAVSSLRERVVVGVGCDIGGFPGRSADRIVSIETIRLSYHT